jgi:hypothetical protein
MADSYEIEQRRIDFLINSMRELFPELDIGVILSKYAEYENSKFDKNFKSKSQHFFDVEHNTKDIRSFEDLELFVSKHV